MPTNARTDDANTGEKRVEVSWSGRGGQGAAGRKQRSGGGHAGEADPARRRVWVAATQKSRRWLMKSRILS